MSLNWSNVSVIFRREVRDQLRDRRTLFMIFILPMLLYPMLGIGVLQLSTAFEQKARSVVVVGADRLPDDPPLLNEARDGFHRSLFDSDAEARRLIVQVKDPKSPWGEPKVREDATRGGLTDAVLPIGTDLKDRIKAKDSFDIPVVFDSADEKSQTTFLRVKEVLARWQRSIVGRRLKDDHLSASYAEPIVIKPQDVATEAELGSSVWAKLFPFLLVMMSLTGAFYPAVDICAGEKERGTMETLLISPASRAEIVMGKFFTVLLASILTALLNLLSMALTGLQLARQLATATASQAANRRAIALIAPPSLETGFWIILLLIPLAVFFSALCLALAVLARSMKEGQYYMTPLYLVCLPLMLLSLAPGVELNLFYSLVPVTGVALLLKSLIQGDYEVAARYFLTVLLPTAAYGALALRWAVDQFQREEVLFREAERFDLKSSIRHLLRDKEPTPTGGEALLCFAMMISLAWFTTQYLLGSASTNVALAGSQIAFVLTPPLAMAVLLTSAPRRTLRLYWPEWRYLGIAVALVLAVNPLVNELKPVIERLFPMTESLKSAIETMFAGIKDLPTALFLFALIPAVCEEVAFRGYILSGLERRNPTRSAILASAVLFAAMHALLSTFQQVFNATLLGLILGLLAVRSRSLLPGIVFHLINNGLAISMGSLTKTTSGAALATWLYRDPAEGLYHVPLVVAGLVVTALLLTRLIPASRQTTPRAGGLVERALADPPHAGVG